jgi:hypothetical protein
MTPAAGYDHACVFVARFTAKVVTPLPTKSMLLVAMRVPLSVPLGGDQVHSVLPEASSRALSALPLRA